MISIRDVGEPSPKKNFSLLQYSKTLLKSVFSNS
nr:MAG TPA: hypothetical protein [Caudoviricetes sp.]